MIYLYRYEGSIGTRFLQVNSGKKYSKLVLLSKDILGANAVSYESMCDPKLSNMGSYVQTAYILNENHVPYEKYLEDEELAELIRVRNVLDSLLEGKKYVQTSFNDGLIEFKLETSISKPELTMASLYRDALLYVAVSEADRAEYARVIKLNSLARIEDLLEKYDCSWVFKDNDPNQMIKDYRCIDTIDSLCWLRDRLAELPDDHFTGYDVETLGVDIYAYPDGKGKSSRWIGFSISWAKDQAVYIPLESKVFATLTIQQVMQVIYKELLRLKLIAHNAQFESKVMYDNGWMLEFAEDTMLLDYNIFPIRIQGWRTLKNLARHWYHHEIWEFAELFGGKADPEMLLYLDKQVLTIYGCADADYARQLKFTLSEYLDKSQEFCYKLDCNIVEILAKAEYYGYLNDKPEIARKETVILEDIKRLETLMDAYVGTAGWAIEKKKLITNLIISIRSSHPGIDNKSLLAKINENFDEEKEYRTFIERIDKLMVQNRYSPSVALKKIMFEVLELPVLAYTSKNKAQRKKEKEERAKAKAEGRTYTRKPRTPSTGADEIALLKQYVLKESSNLLPCDIKSSDELKPSVLLEAKDINYAKYPFARMIEKHSELTKLLTTFISQQMENQSNYGFQDILQAQTATARLTGGGLVIAKEAKKFYLPYPDTYGVNADYAQIEVRYMDGEANLFWETHKANMNLEELSVYHRQGIKPHVEKLCNPETDIHRQTASQVFGIPEELITSDQRSNAKPYTFGTPYGMEAMALSAEEIIKYVDRTSSSVNEVQDTILQDSNLGLSKWYFANYPIYKNLENVRNKGMTPVEYDENGIMKDGRHIPPYWIGRKLGMIENKFGRRKYVELEDLDRFEEASLRKELGNFPIQSGARELFFINKVNLYNEFKRLGLIKNPTNGEKPKIDDFLMTTFVHDEFFGQANCKVHPYIVISTIYHKCFVNLPYHPTYFMGINIVNTWYEGKSGANELPVDLVKRISETPTEDWPKFENGYFYVNGRQVWVVDYFAQLVKNWKHERVLKDIAERAEAVGVNMDTATTAELETVASAITSSYTKPLMVKDSLRFGADKSTRLSAMIKLIWDNKDHNYLEDEIKCSRIEIVDHTVIHDYSKVEEDEEFDLFADLEDDNFDSIRLTTKMKRARDAKRDSSISSQINTVTILDDIEVKARDTYQPKNFDANAKVDTRVILMISGKLVLQLKTIHPRHYTNLLREVEEKYGDPNGSVVDVSTNLGIKRANFRVFNLDRPGLEAILKKYDIA